MVAEEAPWGGVTTRRPRGGNHRLKNAMYTAAFVAAQHGPDPAATTDTYEAEAL